MTQSFPHVPFLRAIQRLDPERLQKALCGLIDGTMTVTLTSQTKTEVHGQVRNGDQTAYDVILTENLTRCSCKDTLYREGVCKHQIALALHVLRTSEEESPPIEPLHLMWRSGAVLCGAQRPARVWCWPWSVAVGDRSVWPEVCEACVVERNAPGRSVRDVVVREQAPRPYEELPY